MATSQNIIDIVATEINVPDRSSKKARALENNMLELLSDNNSVNLN